MAASKPKRNLLSARRRVDEEEGDDYDGTVDLDDDSQSEASVLTVDEPIPASDVGDGSVQAGVAQKYEESSAVVADTKYEGHQEQDKEDTAALFTNTSDVADMVSGFKLDSRTIEEEALEFEDTASGSQATALKQPKQITSQQTSAGSRNGNLQLRTSGRGQNDVRQRTNVTSVTQIMSVPAAANKSDSAKPIPTGPAGRGAARGGMFGGNVFRQPQRSTPQNLPNNNNRWNHDLHEAILKPPTVDTPNIAIADPSNSSSNAPKASKPSLSKTVVLGNVAARVFLSCMDTAKILDKRILVRQHTRLPDLRPPLRRDKPVRVSIPDHTPRYIIPSPERSFIFIPRAQRPNQQAKMRGRGGYMSRGGSRRTSIYGGSAYSPSGAMSRRSSMVVDGMMTPQGTMFTRPAGGVIPTGPTRPVVRFPGANNPYANQMGPGAQDKHRNSISMISDAAYPLPSEPVKRGHRSSNMDMHHPRPQKQMSVASIEGEKQALREQQPFHQQLPYVSSGSQPLEFGQTQMGYGAQPDQGTPLQNIPESAINAQPFMPANMAQSYFAYPMQPMYYYPGSEVGQQAYGVNPLATPGYLAPANYYMPMAMPYAVPAGLSQASAYVPDDSGMMPNGTTYYYDPTHQDATQQTTSALGANPDAAYFTPTSGMGYYTPR